MKRSLTALLLLCLVAACHRRDSWLPADFPEPLGDGPTLCQGAYLTERQGEAVLGAALDAFSTREAWQRYADRVRARIRQGAGLEPLPQRTPLNATFASRRAHDGYSVENVTFEATPGRRVAGNLYRPTNTRPPYAAILTPHGHAADRFSPDVQTRAATLARMGAVVLTIDMAGYGESREPHRTGRTMTTQLWNAMRAVDLLLSLDGADPQRVAVTGESGGATQAFLLTALDPRIKVSVPVVMVSAHFFGGCPCESGRPIHRSADHFASNAMIAALAAPRPMLVVSTGTDWTKNTPRVEYPFLREIYDRYGAAVNVQNAHFEHEAHDYGPSKRAAAYRFLARHLRLDLDAADESRITLEPADAMRGILPPPT